VSDHIPLPGKRDQSDASHVDPDPQSLW